MQSLISIFSYPFIQRALIVGILISLCAALLGVILVLKRYSLIGHGAWGCGLCLNLPCGCPWFADIIRINSCCHYRGVPDYVLQSENKIQAVM